MREVDHGCLETSPDTSLPERLLAIHALVDELIASHEPAVVAVERLFFSKNVQTAFGVGQARGVVLLAAAQHGVPVREATPSEVKSADRGLRRGRQGAGPADGPDGAGHGRAPAPRRRGRRARHRGLGGEHARARSASDARRPVLDRAAVAPIERGLSGYERAVREALIREKAAERDAKRAAKRTAS